MSSTSTRRGILAAATAGATLGIPFLARAQSPVALRVSSAMPADRNAAHFAWFEHFRTKLQDAAGPRIRLDYFPNGQLGKEADVVQQVAIGSVDMMITGSSIWATAVPELGMLDLGYLIDSYSHGEKLLDAGLGDAFGKMLLDRKGITALGWGFHFGARCVYTRAPVHKLADLHAVKLRVLPAPAFIETFKLMGAVPAPIPFNELYTALQSGVVDGFEHDAASVIANRLYEVTKQCFMTEHLFSPMLSVIGRRGLSKIPADLKPVFLQVAAEATQSQRQDVPPRSAEALEQLRQLGITFSPMPPAERAEIKRQMSEQLYAPFARNYPATKPLFEIAANISA
jgi:tripartite ATP-independent transporter DctP family solute receptor